jgi:hypothetical protein
LLNSLLGTLSSGVAASTSSYESIATVAGNSGTSVTLSSIPGTYSHLQVRYYAARDGGSGQLNMRFNSDTGSNYADHYLYGTGALAQAGGDATQTRINYVGPVKDSAYDYKGVGIIDIINYASTTKYKTTRHFSGVDINASGGQVWLSSGLWMSTSAITSITFDLLGDTFGTSTFALYGIKG